MKIMTYAEVIGWEPPEKGSLSDFLGGPPEGVMYDPNHMGVTLDLVDKTTYFADKEVNYGDIMIVVRAMHDEAEKTSDMDCKRFASFVMDAAMMFRRRDCKDEMDFREFCAELSHEINMAKERYFGVYMPDKRPSGRDYVRRWSQLDEDKRAQLTFDEAWALAEKNRYFGYQNVKYLDVCAVLDEMKSQAVVKGMNARRFSSDIYDAALRVVVKKEKDPNAFRVFCSEEQGKLKDHLASYLRENAEKPND